jgi:hypothetical protein
MQLSSLSQRSIPFQEGLNAENAVAEKLAAIRTESFFRERARRANIPEALEVLKRMGEGNSPMKGDELPDAERLYSLGSGRKERTRPTRVGKTRGGLRRS